MSIVLPELKLTKETAKTEDTIRSILDRVEYELQQIVEKDWYDDDEMAIEIQSHNILENEQEIISISLKRIY